MNNPDYDLTGKFISDSYDKLIQKGEDGFYYDGLGNRIDIDSPENVNKPAKVLMYTTLNL